MEKQPVKRHQIVRLADAGVLAGRGTPVLALDAETSCKADGMRSPIDRVLGGWNDLSAFENTDAMTQRAWHHPTRAIMTTPFCRC